MHYGKSWESSNTMKDEAKSAGKYRKIINRGGKTRNCLYTRVTIFFAEETCKHTASQWASQSSIPSIYSFDSMVAADFVLYGAGRQVGMTPPSKLFMS